MCVWCMKSQFYPKTGNNEFWARTEGVMGGDCESACEWALVNNTHISPHNTLNINGYDSPPRDGSLALGYTRDVVTIDTISASIAFRRVYSPRRCYGVRKRVVPSRGWTKAPAGGVAGAGVHAASGGVKKASYYIHSY